MQLARTPRVGPVTFFQLLTRFGTARAVLDAWPTLRHRNARLAPRAQIEAEWRATRDLGAEIVCAPEPSFPSLLKQLAPPPPVLTVRGDHALANRRCVAIVGARQASAAGRKIARDMSKALSERGFIIVSGLARGIDGEAHAAALNAGTIAVLGGGIDQIYPPQHARLHDAIARQGLLVSESPLGHRATARDFPRRNRIITGICEGVVVIEAAERSGSLISARTALEQNRDVMAVPGSPLDSRSAGNNHLLREGAILVRDADDVIEALGRPSNAPMKAPAPPEFDNCYDQDAVFPDQQIDAVLEALSPIPVAIAELARAARISAPRCAAILVELELSGHAVTFPGGLAALTLQETQP